MAKLYHWLVFTLPSMLVSTISIPACVECEDERRSEPTQCGWFEFAGYYLERQLAKAGV